MSVLFFDSSALVKRYLTEAGSAWVLALTDPDAGNTIVVAEITRVEVAAALASRQRAPDGITLADRDRLFRLLAQHCTAEYRAVQINNATTDRAMYLTQMHRLRGYDAVQFAAARAVGAVLPTLTFVSADEDLLTAARAEGLAADNPNLHP